MQTLFKIATCVRAQRCEKRFLSITAIHLCDRNTNVSGMLTEIHGAASGSLFLLSGKMSAIKAKTWVVKKPFEGFPKRDDLEIVEEELPPLKDGG